MTEAEAANGLGAGVRPGISQRLRDTYLSADTRWAGIFRILYGGLLIAELLRCWFDIRLYYTNDGILPNHFALFRPGWQNLFSVFFAFSSFDEVNVAFFLTLSVFVLFTVGYRTKLFQILSLLCITSLNARNLLIENGGTLVVNILGAWTLFLPLGARFSIDSLRSSLRTRHEWSAADLNDRTRSVASTRYTSLAVLALLLQWSVIYFFNFVHKSGASWRNGSAIYWFLEQNRIVTGLGVWARTHLSLSVFRILTHASRLTEAMLSCLLLLPVLRENCRRVAFILALGMHGAIALLSRIGPFSYVMVIQFVIHFSANDFAFVTRWFARPSRARVVVYDVDCGICLYICRVLQRLDVFDRLTFVGNDERERIPERADAALLDRTLLVLTPNGDMACEGRALFEIARALPFATILAFWLVLPGFSELGNKLYRLLAANRARLSVWFGLAQCGVAPKASISERGSRSAVRTLRESLLSAVAKLRDGLVLLLLVVLGTEACVDNPWASRRMHLKRPSWMQAVVELPRLFQAWGMFAPDPPFDDGHLVVDGRTEDGRMLDPFTGRKPVFDPYSATGWGDDQLWCDYTNHIRWARYKPERQFLSEYLEHVHEYAGKPRDKLVSFEVWWVQSKSPRPGQERGQALPPERLLSVGTISDSLATPWLQAGPVGSATPAAPERPVMP